MIDEVMFNLTDLADRLIKERPKLGLANKIKAAVDARSIQVDLMLALEAADALSFSLDQPMSQPPRFREAGEAAQMNKATRRVSCSLTSSTRPNHGKCGRTSFTPVSTTMGFRPDRVTTDGHNSYLRTIRAVLGEAVRHRTSAWSRTAAASRAGSDVCGASRTLTQPSASAANMVNSALAVVTARSSPPLPATSVSSKARTLHSTS